MIRRVGSVISRSIFPTAGIAGRNSITLKAVLILGALGAFLCAAYYLHKSRVSFQKPQQDDKKAALPPSPPTVKQIRFEKLKKLVQRELLETQRLGEAIDNGDCFYDALSQSLAEIGIQKTSTDLRAVIVEYLKTNAEEMEKDIERDPRGIDTFENYKKYVGYSNDEMTTLLRDDTTISVGSYWGDAAREGVILCRAFKFNLKIIGAGCLESSIESDAVYQKLSGHKTEDQGTFPADAPIHQHNEQMIQERLATLYGEDRFYYVDNDTTYPKGESYTRTCTLALFENHYVPVLST